MSAAESPPPGGQPLPPAAVQKRSFRQRPTTLEDVTSRLAVDRHRSDRDLGRRRLYARWVAAFILAVMVCGAVVILLSAVDPWRLGWVLVVAVISAGVRRFFRDTNA